MPRLHCERHGREDEVETVRDEGLFREAGECVLIVSGKLTTGPWLCDRCNAELSKGAYAYLATGFPRWMVEGPEPYDFRYERGYFGSRFDRATFYGARWRATESAASAASSQDS